jgi:hypothetical protein
VRDARDALGGCGWREAGGRPFDALRQKSVRIDTEMQEMQEVKLSADLFGGGGGLAEESEEFGLSFVERRAAANRQRLREQAVLIVTTLLTLMVGVLSLKM